MCTSCFTSTVVRHFHAKHSPTNRQPPFGGIDAIIDFALSNCINSQPEENRCPHPLTGTVTESGTSGIRIVAEEKSNQWPIRPISLYPRMAHFELPATSSLKTGRGKSSIWQAAQRFRFAAAVFRRTSRFVTALMAARDSNPYVRREPFRLQLRSRNSPCSVSA